MKIDLNDPFCYSVGFKGSELIREAPLGFILEKRAGITSS
jgi:hypothetical protein